MDLPKALPRQYAVHSTINLSRNRWLAISLNLGACILFFIFVCCFTYVAVWLHPNLQITFVQMSQLDLPSLIMIFAFLLIVQAVLHELTHSFFFWLFTERRPRFTRKWLQAYAYATAPEDYYLRRNQYVLALAAPFIFITLGGLAWLPLSSIDWVPILVFIMAANAAGAVGDLFMVGWMLRQPPTAIVRDAGVAVIVYQFQPSSPTG
jgi:hypothetical protein